MAKLRIFLADDHVVVRQGLKALIDAQPDMEVVGEADDGRAALQGVRDLGPDIVVMDVSMPRMSGTRAAELLKQERPDVKVLALTAHEDKSYIRQLLGVGVSGYVLKRVAAEELIHAIRTAAKGGVYLDPSLAGRILSGLVQRPAARAGQVEGTLSEREAEVLRLIARGHSNKEIAAQLDVSVKTVETYKARSMEKLGLRSRAGIVSYAVQQGWLSDHGDR
jgi:DNA-binding NarL/FixJ family response regulator